MNAYRDLAAYVALPRITGLALSRDGRRLVATVQEPDRKGAKYVSALWEVPLPGGEPVRLTRSEQGETSPAFAPDGSLLFTSTRPGPDTVEDEPAVWTLGPAGEPQLLARRPGGLGGAVVAGDGSVLVGGSRLAFTPPHGDDAERRRVRKDRKITAILHTGMPIRSWDHELGDASPRVIHLGADGVQTDLAPDATTELENATYSVSDDGATVVTSWRRRAPRGRPIWAYAVVDVASGERTVRLPDAGYDYTGPVLSPDGQRVAVARERTPYFDVPVSVALEIASAGGPLLPELGDLTPIEWAWSADSATLYVAGDLHGRGAVLAVDAATGTVVRRLACDAVYSNLLPAPHGTTLYALRSAIDAAPAPVRLDTGAADQDPVALPSPAPMPPLPGRLEELWVDGVHSWLCLPDSNEPAPVMQWIHGGPFTSYNSWSWRWSPWVAVAQGWAVIMPDPALSTGYGQECIDRAWPYLADVVWREVEAVLDHVLARPDTDAHRTALLGASFGGFMTNWIAGHTDRFRAIVTHAGLWALDQQHATTDNAHFKTDIFDRLEDHPDWYARYSPHNSVDAISTPMLLVHGNRDYRVPVSEAIRMWWDLVSRWDDDPVALPHRFLQLTGENHWVLSPANHEIWLHTVLGFCARHVLGRTWTPSDLL